MIESHT